MIKVNVNYREDQTRMNQSAILPTPQPTSGHIPVLCKEVLEYLEPTSNKVYVDATFGGGGYTRAILDSCACRVIAIDRDPQAAERAVAFTEEYGNRFSFYQTNFNQLATLITSPFDGIVFDFGLSSFQLETPERGFSFQAEGPLDMRMGLGGITAAEVVNDYSEEQLAEIIFLYGQERFSRRISRAIVKARQQQAIRTTLQLANIIHSVVPYNGKIDSATKTFQALRIFVNDELRAIDAALQQLSAILVPRVLRPVCIITVTFHSLEDKIVKNWIQQLKISPIKHYTCSLKTPRVVTPSEEELRMNPRSRSAKLRCVLFTPEGDV